MTTSPREAAGSRPRGPARALSPEHLYKFAGLVFLLALAYRFFDTISRVLLIAYASAILAVVLNALIRRFPIQRRWSAALVGIALFAALSAGLWFGGAVLFAQLRDFIDRLPEMERALNQWGNAVRERTGLNVNLVGERTREMVAAFLSTLGGGDVLGQARGVIEWVAIPLLIFFGGLFALANPNDRLLTPLLRVVPRERRQAFRRLFELLGDRLLGWLKGQFISMATIGVLAAAAFYALDVPYALLLGLVNGLAEFVPIIGPWAGGIPAVVIATIDDPMKGVWTAVAILVIQQLETQIITPLVMSKAAEVHPFVTIFSLVLFGGLFGFLGVLLALPLVLLLWTVIQVLWVERAIDTDEDSITPMVESG